MKNRLKIVYLSIFAFLFIPIAVFATSGCKWQANGCNYVVIYDGSGGGTAHIDCGDGYYEYGSGPVGGCPGNEF